MNLSTRFLFSISVCPLLNTATVALAQGSLTPPGAPAPTFKTLAQVEPRTPISSLPFVITNSGAFYVTTNLFGVENNNGITVSANYVAIDLDGFTLTGVLAEQRLRFAVSRRLSPSQEARRHLRKPAACATKTFSWLPARNLLRYALANTGNMSFYDKLKFDASGLIPAIVQEQGTGRVLMMAWMNRASLEKTIETRKTHFWSRSRQKFWMKGESSGHTQTVKDIAFDCDGDTLLVQVEQIGAACHEGYRSCFFRSVENDGAAFKVTEPQLETPGQIYGRK